MVLPSASSSLPVTDEPDTCTTGSSARTPRTGSRRVRNWSGRPAGKRGHPRVSGSAVTVAPSVLLSSRLCSSPSGPAVTISAIPLRYSRKSALSSHILCVVTGRPMATV